jgi:hypothetical protein
MSVTKMNIKSEPYAWTTCDVRFSVDELPVGVSPELEEKATLTFSTGGASIHTYATHDELLELSSMALLAAQWLKEQQ